VSRRLWSRCGDPRCIADTDARAGIDRRAVRLRRVGAEHVGAGWRDAPVNARVEWRRSSTPAAAFVCPAIE